MCKMLVKLAALDQALQRLVVLRYVVNDTDKTMMLFYGAVMSKSLAK